MLKSGIRVIKKKDLCYIAESENSVKRFKPWLGDSFSFLYDFIMKSSIFPKKFALTSAQPREGPRYHSPLQQGPYPAF